MIFDMVRSEIRIGNMYSAVILRTDSRWKIWILNRDVSTQKFCYIEMKQGRAPLRIIDGSFVIDQKSIKFGVFQGYYFAGQNIDFI